MFCDLVESTSLSERLDPEELRDLICDYQRACLDVVHRNQGHIAQYLGDGVLIYFGYPIAHEDEARRAVRSALAILSRVKDLSKRIEQQSGINLSVRIGIHTGQVVVGEVGSGYSSAQLALGEAPNLAARAQNLADPDTIVISAATHQLVEPFFICQDLGIHSIKGKAHPVQLFRVLGETKTQTRMQAAATSGMAPLVGREREGRLLREYWERAKKGRGQSVLVSGEAGIGKSRVLEQLKEQLAGEMYCFLDGYCSSDQQHTAFSPISDLLGRALGISTENSIPDNSSKLNEAIAELGFESKDVPIIAQILSIPVSMYYSPLDLTPIRQRQLTLETLTAWMFRTAKDRPVLFVMEDLHWADPSTLELLAFVMNRHQEQRVMILVSFRPEFSPFWPPHEGMHEIKLTRLLPEQTAVLAKHVAQNRALPAEVLHEVVKRTDGVPLFVEEMTKMVLQSGYLKLVNGNYELTGVLPPRAIPTTVQDSLMARLDRLGSEKNLVQWGAVLGREFRYDVLQEVSRITEARLQEDLSRLVDADLVTQNGSPPRATYVFRHALIQDAAYESLLKSTRRLYHQRIAEVLEDKFAELVMTAPELVAQHCTSAGFNEKAIRYWEKAGQRALERAANREAINHLKLALETLKTLPNTGDIPQLELRLQLLLMPAHMAIRGWASKEVEACCVRARELCIGLNDHQHLFGALWGLWTVYLVRGELQEALVVAMQVLEMALSAKEKMLEVMGHHAVGFTRYFRGELLESKRHAIAGIGLFDLEVEKHIVNAFQFSSTMALRFFLSASLWLLGSQKDSEQELAKASALIEAVQHAPSSAAFMAYELCFYLYSRDTTSMRSATERLIKLSEAEGFQLYIPVGMMYSGWALAAEGQVAQGLEQIERGLAAYRATGSFIKYVEVMAIYGEALHKAGRTDDAVHALEEGMRHADTREEHLLESELYRIRGNIRLDQNREVEAAGDLDRAIEIARRQGAVVLELRAVMSKCRLLWAQGKKFEAQSELRRLYDSLGEDFHEKDRLEAKSLLDELCVS